MLMAANGMGGWRAKHTCFLAWVKWRDYFQGSRSRSEWGAVSIEGGFGENRQGVWKGARLFR